MEISLCIKYKIFFKLNKDIMIIYKNNKYIFKIKKKAYIKKY